MAPANEPGWRNRTCRRRRFGDAHSATPVRRPPFRRRDVSATASSATGHFGDGKFQRRDVLAPLVIDNCDEPCKFENRKKEPYRQLVDDLWDLKIIFYKI